MMLKQARSLLSRKFCNPSNSLVGEGSSFRSFASWADSSSTRRGFSLGKSTGRVFAPYAVFKGKAALSVEPVLPSFIKVDSGDFRIERRGSLMLTFMPAIGERKYDWGKRQRFALSATEVGSLISMGPSNSSEFFHDPSMKSSGAGQVKKSLSVKPLADGSGYFISLSVNNSILKTMERFTVPVTTAEFAVMKTACSFALPHIMGWDRLTSQVRVGTEGNNSKVDPQLLEIEWDK
ncbi:PREDICTED: single-stranded DNA-binding protein WHY2, mitochondrial [Tarenaya hassleriana]|uniref:single-stranded DNA-binding protein WHY2, mitochondrial n=1 Tax=Tarenaya hassleriana TaxID=28532 RepID=UPI00053C2A0A|nr:PREDICTED: single-stranded DNA-binding protein WHY2, mitochondrial [Tarenaya hassleriana]